MNKILVVDDEATMRRVLTSVLTRSGYEVLEASNGLIGLNLYKENPGCLILTDLFMPEMDGLEMIKEIILIDPDAKIVATSGAGHLGNGSYLDKAIEAGASKVLTKPFKLNQILESVKELL